MDNSCLFPPYKYSAVYSICKLYTQYVDEHELYQKCNMLPECYIELKYALVLPFSFYSETKKLYFTSC